MYKDFRGSIVDIHYAALYQDIYRCHICSVLWVDYVLLFSIDAGDASDIVHKKYRFCLSILINS